MDLQAVGQRAKAAARVLALAPTEQKNAALVAIATALGDAQTGILEANAADVAAARASGMNTALLDRLTLSESRLAAIAADVRKVATLPDPVGERFDETTLPNGLRVHKRRVPMGVVGTIYESRPNVTVDIASLCLKAGSAAILRGGSDTLRSSAALVQTMRAAIERVGLPADSVQGLNDPDRDLIRQLLRLDRYVDVVIPRGGAGLHRFCRENASVPVITGGIGICHIFVDTSADATKALPIILNAKTSRPSVCNALDTLLVHREALGMLPQIAEQLGSAGVALRCDPEALALLEPLAQASGYEVAPVADSDYDTEWMALTMSIRVVAGLDEALDHIAAHGDHTDVIITEDTANAERFLTAVDSAWVGHNASTRFNDGGQMGLGAEIIISTQKLHARGPLGLNELTSYKWVVAGDGQVRA